jgi:hypothetical protein
MNPKLYLVSLNPIVWEQHRHYRDHSPISDHQVGLENHRDPYVLHEDMIVVEPLR